MAEKKKVVLSQAAAVLGEKGGKVGGPARAHVLSKVRRVEIARKGGKAAAAKKK